MSFRINNYVGKHFKMFLYFSEYLKEGCVNMNGLDFCGAGCSVLSSESLLVSAVQGDIIDETVETRCGKIDGKGGII